MFILPTSRDWFYTHQGSGVLPSTPYTGGATSFGYVVIAPNTHPANYQVYARLAGGGLTTNYGSFASNNGVPTMNDLPVSFSNAIWGWDNIGNTLFVAPVSVSPTRCLIGSVFSISVPTLVGQANMSTNGFIGAPYLWISNGTNLYRLAFNGVSAPVLTTFGTTTPSNGGMLSNDFHTLYLPSNGGGGTSGMFIYDVSSGTPTLIGSPFTLHSYAFAYCQSQNYLALGATGGGPLDIWKYSGTSLTLVSSTNPLSGTVPGPGIVPTENFIYYGSFNIAGTVHYANLSMGIPGPDVGTGIAGSSVLVPTGNFWVASGGGGASVYFKDPVSNVVSLIGTIGNSNVTQVWVT